MILITFNGQMLKKYFCLETLKAVFVNGAVHVFCCIKDDSESLVTIKKCSPENNFWETTV